MRLQHEEQLATSYFNVLAARVVGYRRRTIFAGVRLAHAPHEQTNQCTNGTSSGSLSPAISHPGVAWMTLSDASAHLPAVPSSCGAAVEVSGSVSPLEGFKNPCIEAFVRTSKRHGRARSLARKCLLSGIRTRGVWLCMLQHRAQLPQSHTPPPCFSGQRVYRKFRA